LRALGTRIAELARGTARLIMVPIRYGLRLLRDAARTSGSALARVWDRVATVCHALASMLGAGMRRVGHAIRLILTRLGLLLRHFSEQVVSTIRPVGRALCLLATRAGFLVRESCRAIVGLVRPHARALVIGLLVRAKGLARGLVLVARLVWSVTRRQAGKLARRLDGVLLLVRRVVGSASGAALDVVLVSSSRLVESLMPLRVAMGRAMRLVTEAVAVVLETIRAVVDGIAAIARRRLIAILRVVLVPVVVAGLIAVRLGQAIGRSVRQAASEVRAAMRRLVEPTQRAARSVRAAAGQAATATRAALRSASAAIREGIDAARSLGGRHR
jgi:hypothetical protein